MISHGDCSREPVLEGHQLAVRSQIQSSLINPTTVLPGRHGADRPGEDVIEQQGRDREPGEPAAHRLLDDPVDAAAHEHGAALDVDAAHGVAEEHDRQDEPGRALPICDSTMPPM